MSKRKDKKKNSRPQAVVQQPTAEAIPVEEKPVASEQPEQYLDELFEEIDRYKKEKEAVRAELEQLQAQKLQLAEEKNSVQTACEAIQQEYDQAVMLIDTAQNEAAMIREKAAAEGEQTRKDAREEAQKLVADAGKEADLVRADIQKERAEELARVSEEAREIWKEQTDDLKKQLQDLSRREKELNRKEIQLAQNQEDLEIDQEALADQQQYLKLKQKEYEQSNPAAVDKLTRNLNVEKGKYIALCNDYEAVSKKYQELQAKMDSIKTEVEDIDGGQRLVSASQLLQSLQEFKGRFEALQAIYSKYPDDDSIAALEEKARNAQRLEEEKRAIEAERDSFRLELTAAKSSKRELEAVRQEVAATQVLNDHLLQELESHKTALESRTGDTCPSLSKVDAEADSQDFINDINGRVQRDEIKSLPALVRHVKNYAGSRPKEKQLYYKDNDIRAFLAGMAVSRLLILQGMSGTGKSSLPRIFAEAVSGFNRLIPVESSWRDRNELLGYYNDFNKKFNAKSFTVELYRSCKKRCREIPTFIVLDEMNLARIEYYFSDFLAILQEPDHRKWLIELVPSDMRTLPMELPEAVKQKMQQDSPDAFEVWEKIERSRQGDLKAETTDDEKTRLTSYLGRMGMLTGAKDLLDGRKIRITDNIWFIGTANRDESTFEISDKVYDRAQVVSLNEKGKPESKYDACKQKYISVTTLQALFEEAIQSSQCRKEVIDRLDDLDQVMMEKFDTSFGNRIVTQTIDFAAVFTAAGGTLVDALDYQISTKILRKVLTSDDAEAFQALLAKTSEYTQTSRQISKRIKELS